MKKRTYTYERFCILIALIACLGLTETMAQPPGNPERRGGPDMDHRPHLERWLDRLSEEDPDEYQRLIALRENDPATFRMEMRSRVQEARRIQQPRGPHPDPQAPFARPPREERPPRGEGFRADDADDRMGPSRHRRILDPRMEHDARLRGLVEQWKRAGSPEEKEAARAAVQSQLETTFDQGMEEQEKEIRHAEERLATLRNIHQSRRDDRDVWISRTMEILLREQGARGRDQDRARDRGRDRTNPL